VKEVWQQSSFTAIIKKIGGAVIENGKWKMENE